MFFSSFVALALATSALAGPFKRFDGITVELSGPAASVGSIDDLKFTASIKNTGSEAVKILKYGTILDEKLPTKSFTVTKDGVTVPFTGIKVCTAVSFSLHSTDSMLQMSVSLTDIDDSAFAIIPAGETITVNHEGASYHSRHLSFLQLTIYAVASLFDFAWAGPGKFAFEPITTFQVAGGEESTERLSKVQATTSKVEVEVTGDVVKRALPELNKRATDICTTASRKTFIDARLVSRVVVAEAYVLTLLLVTLKENLSLPALLPTSAATARQTLFTRHTSEPPRHPASPLF
jgi:deuterolysin